MEIGKVCIKLTGRDSNKPAVVIDIIGNKVLIDGATRRRKVNVNHVKFLDTTIKLKKNAKHEEIVKALNEAGFEIKNKESNYENKTPKKTK